MDYQPVREILWAQIKRVSQDVHVLQQMARQGSKHKVHSEKPSVDLLHANHT